MPPQFGDTAAKILVRTGETKPTFDTTDNYTSVRRNALATSEGMKREPLTKKANHPPIFD
ncbi:MAG: hypothetical protein ACI8S3_002409 [Alphaproteobacteria bacterium]|jgi:hypothetical protein